MENKQLHVYLINPQLSNSETATPHKNKGVICFTPNIKTNPYGQVFPLVLSEIGIMSFPPVLHHFVCDFEIPYEGDVV